MERELYISTNTASGPNSATRTEPFVKIIALVATLVDCCSATIPA